MANLKISDLPTDIVTLAAGDRFPVYDASATTTNTYCTPPEIQTFACIAPVFAAGTASAGTWPKLTVGTILTTAEVGAFELDSDVLYFCTDDGNRGYVPARHFIRCDSANTLADSTSSQKLFSSPTNGAITLETGTYKFKAVIRISSMAVANGNCLIDILGAGSATAGAWMWHALGWDNNGTTATRTLSGSFHVASASGAAIVAANTAPFLELTIMGMCEITGAGTLIPSITLLTGGVTPSVNVGTFFEIRRVGSTGLISIGQWS
tara:strand:- start:26 stop:820 length:795 start_codon:yes stop_codon:yes gene_type:complete